jgi:hypothetical protein
MGVNDNLYQEILDAMHGPHVQAHAARFHELYDAQDVPGFHKWVSEIREADPVTLCAVWNIATGETERDDYMNRVRLLHHALAARIIEVMEKVGKEGEK